MGDPSTWALNLNVVAMAAAQRQLFALDAQSNIWRLELYGANPRWELADDAPAAAGH